MTPRLLTLVFPQWQGSGDRRDTYHGALYLRDKLLAGQALEEVPVSLDAISETERGIRGYKQILQQLRAAGEILERARPDRIFLAGGDCGTELAPISHLNRRYGGDLAVLWFDAHGDLNSPATSVTGNFHGMPLRCLLGDGDEALVGGCFALLRPEQVIMAGTRELDPPEEAFIRETSIGCVTVGELRADPRSLVRLVEAKGYGNVYVHIDLDVLYPDKYPWVQCPCENGLDAAELLETLAELKKAFNVAGISVLELRPVGQMDDRPLKELVRFCQSL